MAERKINPISGTDRNYLNALDTIIFDDDGMHRITINRLKELVEADKEGRCVVLPCKVGDTVYVVSKCKNVNYCLDNDWYTGTGAQECPFEKDCMFEDCEGENERVFKTSIRGAWIEDNHVCEFCDTLNYEIVASEVGKSVFLTEPEAQAALERRDEPSNWMDNKKCYDAVIKTFGKDE